MFFSHRTNWPSSSNPLMANLQSLRDGNQKILDLTESNPTQCRFQYPADKILAALSSPDNLIYQPDSKGISKAREAISRYYQEQGADVPPENIFCTSSTSEGYSYLFRLLADPQDGVLFPQPSYPLFACLGDLDNVELTYYPLKYNDGWQIDFSQLKKRIRNNSKAVVLVNPNNPTGSYVKGEEVRALNAICQENNLALISDEVFFDFALSADSRRTSLVNNSEVLTFVLSGLSKTLALPQMKLSWITVSGPDALVQEAIRRLEIISDTYLSVNTPVQNALPEWLEDREEIQKEVVERLWQNLTCLEEAVRAAGNEGISVLKPEGGWYAVLRLPEGIDEEEFALNLLKEEAVFVHPGYFFDFAEGAHLVLSLLPVEDIFAEGVKRILKKVSK